MKAACAQDVGKLLGLAARGAIDDAALAAAALQKVGDLLASAGLGAHGQAQVGAVEAVDEQGRRLGEQLVQNIGTGRGVGGRGERRGLHAAQFRLHCAERCVFGPEVVTPLRNAMRLVDRKQRYVGTLEERNRLAFEQTFGRHIDETQFTACDPLENGAVLRRIVGRVQARRRDAVGAQLRHLVAHQRNQRRHDDGEPVAHKRRKLIAERLAAAGRHHGEHVATVQNGGDDIGLTGPEVREAEYGAKALLRGGEVRHKLLGVPACVPSLFEIPPQHKGSLRRVCARSARPCSKDAGLHCCYASAPSASRFP